MGNKITKFFRDALDTAFLGMGKTVGFAFVAAGVMEDRWMLALAGVLIVDLTPSFFKKNWKNIKELYDGK